MDNEFRLSDDICHLNHAAVGPWPQRTVDAVRQFAHENGNVGSRHYDRWLKIEQQLREQLRTLINAPDSDEIALLKSTSEALSVIAWGLDWRLGDEIVIPHSEFPSNRIVWESLEVLGVKVISVNIDGPDPEIAIENAFSERTRLLSVSSVQYSNGFRLHLDKLGASCKRNQVLFCVDAIQSLAALPFDVQSCQADFVVADGHKWMLGPEGLALFYCRREWIDRLRLHQFGWHMVEAMGEFDRPDWDVASSARRFECGSPNMLGIHALSASLSLVLEYGLESISDSISLNTSYLIELLTKNGAIILSSEDRSRQSGIVTFILPNEDTGARYRYLQDNGVICALRGGGIRFSPHFYTPRSVLDRALQHTFATLPRQ